MVHPMDSIKCDVLIVGSGLAGASAANWLDRLGVKDVAVLERLSPVQHRRYHSVCGEAVSSRMLGLAGVGTEHSVREVDVISISVNGSEPSKVRVKGHVIDRNAMIEGLLPSSARRIRGRAVSVSVTEDGFTVETTAGRISCRSLIGADGAHSVVRRDVFGSRPEFMVKAVNTLVPGECDNVLRFSIGGSGPSAYSWRFPSTEGMNSVGFVKGEGTVPEGAPHGGRCIPVGRVPEVQCGRCLLVGDAAAFPNPISCGGIGAALVSGRKAAEAVASGDYQGYGRWVDKSVIFDRRFMDAFHAVSGWTGKEAQDAMRPLAGYVGVPRGMAAMLRRPGYARVYMACWMAFRHGWRPPTDAPAYLHVKMEKI